MKNETRIIRRKRPEEKEKEKDRREDGRIDVLECRAKRRW